MGCYFQLSIWRSDAPSACVARMLFGGQEDRRVKSRRPVAATTADRVDENITEDVWWIAATSLEHQEE